MKDLKSSLDKFNSSIEKLNSVITSINTNNPIRNKKAEGILLKENENLKYKYADTLNKLEKILLKINSLEKSKKNV
jgi:hypothetical protein